jgi:hypothetical protein
MFKKKVREIERQLDRYCEYKARRSNFAAEYDRAWLRKFIDMCGAENVVDVTDKDCREFCDYLQMRYRSRITVGKGMHALEQFLRCHQMSNLRRKVRRSRELFVLGVVE